MDDRTVPIWAKTAAAGSATAESDDRTMIADTRSAFGVGCLEAAIVEPMPPLPIKGGVGLL